MTRKRLDLSVVVPLAAAGDKQEQDALMSAFFDWSVSEAMKTGCNEELARDIAVEFWAKLLYGAKPGIQQFDPEKGAFFSWMKQRLQWAALNGLRQKRPQLVYFSHVNDPEEWSTGIELPGEPQDEAEAREMTDRMLAALDNWDRRIFDLLASGCTTAEIAKAMHIHASAVRVEVARVRRKCAEAIKEKGPEGP